jgi:hypothetical protein
MCATFNVHSDGFLALSPHNLSLNLSLSAAHVPLFIFGRGKTIGFSPDIHQEKTLFFPGESRK